MFIRIDENNKNKRVAIILINYNMNENTDKIVEKLKTVTKHPTDIIIVDNGSDKIQPSKYTTISLAKNVQTTNGWLMGLHYADALSVNENFQYFAYAFVITSTYIDDINYDIINKLSLRINDKVVGVHPSLSKDSTTGHKHLYCQNKGIREVKFIDNIFSFYKADWFNFIGRFNPKMTYAWAIDIETGYLARRSGFKVCIDDEIIVKKITNIGYSMNRMSESAKQRQVNARKQMIEYFKEKYGSNYFEIIY